MSVKPVIAVFDVGKTNKKVFLFDEQYNIVYEESQKFSEITDEDGDPCENLSELITWIKDSLSNLISLKDYSIRALNFSSYGASFVHINKDGNPILPLYNYLKPFPAELKNKFYNTYGSEQKISKETASPVLDNLNSGLQLYRLKYEKALLDKPGFSLHLPQFLSFLITQKPYSDITSIGCHTMLWNFQRDAYHDWVYKENIIQRLAPVFPSDKVIPAGGEWNQLKVGVGLHDSSSALIPYLSGFNQPFILISTGTWCISLNPFNDTPLTVQELEQDCLCYMTYKKKPVKASRLFAGHEHEEQVKRLAEHFSKQVNYYESIQYNSETIISLKENFEQDNRNEFHPGPSLFRHRDLNIFKNYEEAYHQLILDIMRQQILSTSLVMKGTSVKRIFVDGGFGKNAIYMNLLAVSFPDVEVFAASVAQATALGAALAIHRHWNKLGLPSDLIGLKYYTAMKASPPMEG